MNKLNATDPSLESYPLLTFGASSSAAAPSRIDVPGYELLSELGLNVR